MTNQRKSIRKADTFRVIRVVEHTLQLLGD